MKKKQKIKKGRIASGRFAIPTHRSGYLSCGLANFITLKAKKWVIKEVVLRQYFFMNQGDFVHQN
ncbi:hypothetical protein [Mucilaginibacter sp.]|uniref:hypothetical protein n=1 Tax=Mucilaginibacter sp. TaxID=1882438 RepID=UPI003AFFA1A9